IKEIAPVPLAQAAADVLQSGPPGWQRAMEAFWYGDPDFAWRGEIAAETIDQSSDGDAAAKSSRWLAWIFLQPYAECLAGHRESAIVPGTPSTCPLCGCKPIVGVLRGEG